MELGKELIKLSSLILDEKVLDAQRYSKQLLIRLAKIDKSLSDDIIILLKKNNNQDITKSVRFAKSPMPVDQDTRLELIKSDYPNIENDLTWPIEVQKVLNDVVKERAYHDQFIKFDLKSTSSMLFVGEPGVGKTLAAAWLASKLEMPFYILDLSAVMSSYLGRTGSNIRTVLDFAKKQSAVLLLDEFDAIAKRRDDNGEVGELKRLVTVLLQEIENWPQDSLLLAATNHENLLDPAVWRRFDKVVKFPVPSYKDIKHFLNDLTEKYDVSDKNLIILAFVFNGSSYAIIEREIKNLMKKSILNQININDLIEEYINDNLKNIDKHDKSKMRELAKLLINDEKLSQRTISEITGISRPTLSKLILNK